MLQITSNLLPSEGVVELWLTSEDTGAYGKDIGVTLPELLWQLVEVIPEGAMLRIGMTNPPYILEHLEVNAVWLVTLGACSQHEGGQPTFPTHPFKQFFQVTGSVKSRLDRDSFSVNFFYSELNTNYSYPAKAETRVCFLSSGNRTTTPCYSLYSWEKMHVPLFVSFFAVEKIILLLVTFISSACVCSFLSFLMSSDWWHSLTIFFSFFSGNGKDIEPSPCLQFSACSCPECIRQCSQWHEKRVLCWWFSSCCRFLKRKVSPHYEYN